MRCIIRSISIVAVMILSVPAISAQQRMTATEYIEKYKALALESQEVYGIPVSIKLAQGLLESDYGNSRLAVEANNHFGIKCKSDWTGMTISHDDDAAGECFRRYSTPEDSYLDHSEFLDKSPRYQALFDLDVTDYKGWARGLKAAGYATNPRYAELLIKVIEDNFLYMFDAGADVEYFAVLSDTTNRNMEAVDIVPAGTEGADKIDVDNYVISMRNFSGYPVYYNNGSEFVLARENDTYGSLSNVVGVSEKKLRKYNDAGESTRLNGGDQVYIKPKLKKVSNGKLMHIVKEGETMHSISQLYGIKLKKLAALNRRAVDSQLSPGQQIRLM